MRKIFGGGLLVVALGLGFLPWLPPWCQPIRELLTIWGYDNLASPLKAVIVVSIAVIGMVLLRPEKHWFASDPKWYNRW